MSARTVAMLAIAPMALLLASGSAIAQAMPEMPPQPSQLPADPWEPEAGSPFVVYPVRDGVFMISGPESNVVVQTGTDGVIVVDTGGAKDVEALLATIRKISKKAITYILLTDSDPEHVGGNPRIAASGQLLAGGNERPTVIAGGAGTPIIAHEEVMNRLVAENAVAEMLPSQTYFVDQKDLHFNGEPVTLYRSPGHNAGGSLVMFRRSDVIAAGGTYTPDRYPFIDLAHGGSIRKYLESLNHLIKLTVPQFNQEGGTYVVPGHGRLSDEGDIQDYRDMVTFIHDRVQAMIDQKMTLAQVKAARPTLDYDTLYGVKAGDTFVEQIYTSLTTEGAAQ